METKSLKVNKFEKNKRLAFIHQKGQKLSTALYLVTNHMRDNEPLKWQLRDKSLRLISNNLSGSDENSSVCLELLSLIEVARAADLLGQMNFEILKKELVDLLAVIEQTDAFKDNPAVPLLSEDFFRADRKLLENSIGQSYKGQDSVFDNLSFTTPPTLPLAPLVPQTRSFAPKPAPLVKQKDLQDLSDKKQDRQALIIEAVKKMKEVTIKDVIAVVPDCSEKTIQRELLSMVSKGILKKVGERRWSKYSLN